MNQDEPTNAFSQLIAKCWMDAGFKQQLLADPVATLKAEGVKIPAELDVKVLENTNQMFHLVIPPKPGDLSDDELDQVSGGFCGVNLCCQPYIPPPPPLRPFPVPPRPVITPVPPHPGQH